MAILIDTARWPAHGRLWAHLISDTSLDELHAFAAAHGIPRRGFDLDHYDVSSREIVSALRDSGLRVTARERRSRA
jgi:hypothetical protein